MIWCGIKMMYEKYISCIDRTWSWCDLMIWFYAHLLYIWYDVIYCDLINYDLYNGVLWFNGIIYIYIWQWTIGTSLICTNLNLMCIYIIYMHGHAPPPWSTFNVLFYDPPSVLDTRIQDSRSPHLQWINNSKET
jgi:hypothetical protein